MSPFSGSLALLSPRFEHRHMHSVLRCYDRPIHCPRHDQPAFTDPERLVLAGSWLGTAG